KARRRVVLQAHWTAWISPLMERMRRSEKYLAVLEPFLGKDIKQITHQIHWKPPGAKYFLSLSSGCALQGRQDQGFRSPREHRDHRARDRPADQGERRAAGHCGEPPTRLPRAFRRRTHHGRSDAGRGAAPRRT